MLIPHRLFGDEQLVASWVAGDSRAGDELARRYRPAVVQFAAHAYHLDPDTAQEIAQTTFVRLHSCLHTFRGKASLRTFVLSIASHACLDLRRGRAATRRDREKPLDEAPDPSDGRSDPAPQVVLSLDLGRCLEQLTERARTLLLARVRDGWSYEELAGRLEMTVGSVGRVIHEARRAMQQCLEQANEGEEIGPSLRPRGGK